MSVSLAPVIHPPVKVVATEETESSRLLHSRLQSPLPWGPKALTPQIFAFLPAPDLARVAGTSISTAVLSRHANLWEALYHKEETPIPRRVDESAKKSLTRELINRALGIPVPENARRVNNLLLNYFQNGGDPLQDRQDGSTYYLSVYQRLCDSFVEGSEASRTLERCVDLILTYPNFNWVAASSGKIEGARSCLDRIHCKIFEASIRLDPNVLNDYVFPYTLGSWRNYKLAEECLKLGADPYAVYLECVGDGNPDLHRAKIFFNRRSMMSLAILSFDPSDASNTSLKLISLLADSAVKKLIKEIRPHLPTASNVCELVASYAGTELLSGAGVDEALKTMKFRI